MIEYKYRPEIDGLRALAVVLVLLFHCGLGFPGGYVGVDVFFVISGFLITGLIIRKQEEKRFSLGEFWARRIKRILPVAALVGVTALFVGYFVLLPRDFRDLARSLVAQQMMLSNVYFWRNSDYFASDSDLMPLLHNWSLAVEEQFYLAFPIVLVMLRKFKKRTTFILLLVASVLSLTVSVWGVNNEPVAAFYLLPTRAWELLAGSMLVYFKPLKTSDKVLSEFGSISGIAMVLYASVMYSTDTDFPGFAAIVPCLGAVLFIYSNSTLLTGLGRILARDRIVFVGLISYSLYLWHWPILAFVRYLSPFELTVSARILALVASFCVAMLSWRFVETPFRTGFQKTSISKLASLAVGSATIVIAIAQYCVVRNGFPERLPNDVRRIAESIPTPNQYRSNLQDVINGTLPLVGNQVGDAGSYDFIVWGDSHAMAMGIAFDAFAKSHDLLGVIAARPATAPLIGVWRPGYKDKAEDAIPWNDSVVSYIRRQGIKNVVLVGRWDIGIDGNADGRTNALLAADTSNVADKKTAKVAMIEGLSRTLGTLNDFGCRVWVVKQVPLQLVDPQRFIVQSLLAGNSIPRGVSRNEHDLRQQNANSIIDHVVGGRDDACAVDFSKTFFNQDGFSIIGSNAGSYYRDTHHISDLGATTLIAPAMDEILGEISRTNGVR